MYKKAYEACIDYCSAHVRGPMIIPCPTYDSEGCSDQNQAVATGYPSHVITGRFFRMGRKCEARVYVADKQKLPNSTRHSWASIATTSELDA